MCFVSKLLLTLLLFLSIIFDKLEKVKKYFKLVYHLDSDFGKSLVLKFSFQNYSFCHLSKHIICSDWNILSSFSNILLSIRIETPYQHPIILSKCTIILSDWNTHFCFNRHGYSIMKSLVVVYILSYLFVDVLESNLHVSQIYAIYLSLSFLPLDCPYPLHLFTLLVLVYFSLVSSARK